MILDITEIKYFLQYSILRNLSTLFFFSSFFFFLFLIFVSYKTFKSIESGVASNTESESFVLGLNNWRLCPFAQLIHQFKHSYSNFQNTINKKQYSNKKKTKYLNNQRLCPFPQFIHQFRHSYSNFQSTINQKQYSNLKKKKKQNTMTMLL